MVDWSKLTGSLQKFESQLFTTVLGRKASRKAQHVKPWGGWATAAQDHIRSTPVRIPIHVYLTGQTTGSFSSVVSENLFLYLWKAGS